MKEINYIITNQDQGKELKQILKHKLYVSSRLLTKLKQANAILINHIPQYVNYIVQAGDMVTLDFVKMNECFPKPAFQSKFKLMDTKLDILYEDEYLLIVNKPANLPVHPSAEHYENTLANQVACYLEKQNIFSIHILTRLDKNTTGICMFAKHEYIQELFVKKKGKIDLKKYYIAIVDKILEKDHDIIEKKIARKKDSIIVREVDENGEEAKTEYFVLKRNIKKDYTVVKILLHTGRTHQIRVHMLSIGHILLGDDLYGTESNISHHMKEIQRQALHAYQIEFFHPITEQKIFITAPIPHDMQKLI